MKKIHDKGQMTALERVAELVDEGTWYPLNTLYNLKTLKLEQV